MVYDTLSVHGFIGVVTTYDSEDQLTGFQLAGTSGQAVTTDIKGNQTRLPLNLTTYSSPLAHQYDALGRRLARTGTGGSVV